MPLAQDSLERQLTQASAELSAWVKILDGRDVSKDDRRSDPKWRTLNARCHQLRQRMGAVSKVAARDEEAARRKVEKATAAEAAPEPEPAPAPEAPAKAKKSKKKAAAE